MNTYNLKNRVKRIDRKEKRKGKMGMKEEEENTEKIGIG